MQQIRMKALVGRINRKLAKDERTLRKASGWNAKDNLGDWYVCDQNRNVHDHHVDQVELAKELMVLGANEKVAELLSE